MLPSDKKNLLQQTLGYLLEEPLIDEIAFMRLDERLLKYIVDQAKLLGTMELHHTHQEIAEDLHSSRVVISRLLKQLEQKGTIQIKRNRIILQHI
ncbi:MAG: helix-turn-helix domain-containing protein [Flavobacteriales bacterium]